MDGRLALVACAKSGCRELPVVIQNRDRTTSAVANRGGITIDDRVTSAVAGGGGHLITLSGR
jgi:hypothetical protein